MTKQMSHHSTFSCFRPSTTTTTTTSNHHHSPPSPPPSISSNPNLTTCLYHTHLGIFSLTWSRSFLGHSLHLQLHHHHQSDFISSSPFSLSSHHHHRPLSLFPLFHLHIKPFTFWKKNGSKKIFTPATPDTQIFWDLSRAKFGSRPEPQSGFYVAVVVDGEMTLLVGDMVKEAHSKTKAFKPELGDQVFILRREHVFGNKVYTTKARFGGKDREISIDCTLNCDARLCFSVDNKRVLQIKRLKWKFRGNERIEVDGVPIQVSWDVYNWLFDGFNNGHAVFMFRFEDLGQGKEEDCNNCSEANIGHEKNNGGLVSLQQNSSSYSFGMSGIEWKKMRKSLLRTARSSSSSSISMSSASSGCSSSVMEWASTADESELSGPVGFSLLVYAWKK